MAAQFLFGNQSSQGRYGVKAKELRDLDELAHVDPALASLIIAHEGLWATHLLGERGLGEALGMACFNQEAAELVVNGVAPHGARLCSVKAYTKF